MGQIPHFMTIRAEGLDPPNLTVKRPFGDFHLGACKILFGGSPPPL